MSSSLSPSPWLIPPESLSLEPGWAHIFRLNLDFPQPISPDHWKILSPQERERAQRFRSEKLRLRFSYAHVQVRQILAAYLHSMPGEIEFSQGLYGKPKLANNERLRFNLTHSAEKGLFAICEGHEIGVDLEGLRGNLDRDSIARHFFSPSEAASISGLPFEQQASAFLACWTRKEAYIKARGGGLSIPLDSFEVSVIPGEPVTLYDPVSNRNPNQQWSIFEIDPGSGFSASLAVEGSLDGIKCWDWQI